MKKSCLKNKKLLIISDDPLIKVDNLYFASNPIIYFWKELSLYFKDVSLFFPYKREKKPYSIFKQPFTEGNLKVFPRTFYISKKMAIKNPKIFLDIIRLHKLILNSDIIIFKIPSLLFIPFYFLYKFYKNKYYKNKLFIIYIAGDLLERNKNNKFYKRIAIIYDRKIKKLSGKDLIILATGRNLANKYNAKLFDISLIKEKEIENCVKMKKNKVQLLYVGRLDKNKGVDILISAFRDIVNSYEGNIKLVIVGDGKEKDRLINIVKQKNLDKYITFKGSLPYGKELKNIFCESNLFILPSLSEGIPKVLYEAMAFKLPIIATKVGGIPTLTENGKAAILVKPNDPKSLAKGIKKVIENENIQKLLIEEGIKIIKNHTLEKKLNYLLNLIWDKYKCVE